jgi:hypothetical protein
MPMTWSSRLYEGGATYFRQQVKFVAVCSTQPTTLAELRGTSSTGTSLAVSSSAAATDFTYAASTQTPAGFKLTVASFSSMQVTDVGVADHVAFGGSSHVLYVVTCTTRSLTTSDKVTVPSFDLLDMAGPAT